MTGSGAGGAACFPLRVFMADQLGRSMGVLILLVFLLLALPPHRRLFADAPFMLALSTASVLACPVQAAGHDAAHAIGGLATVWDCSEPRPLRCTLPWYILYVSHAVRLLGVDFVSINNMDSLT